VKPPAPGEVVVLRAPRWWIEKHGRRELRLRIVEAGEGRPLVARGLQLVTRCGCDAGRSSFRSPYAAHRCPACRSTYVALSGRRWARVEDVSLNEPEVA
jgi:hypothetical protein